MTVKKLTTRLNVNDFITHINNPEDLPFLRTQLLEVNMRLFNNKRNKVYRAIIKNCCDYLKFCALQEMDGYRKPYGMSGANIGIPFNIIGVVRNRNKMGELCEVMINPRIVQYSGDKTEAETNCGSIRLKIPIKVDRDKAIEVEWYDEQGMLNLGTFTRETGGFTIQHEVDHNMGILITDVEVEKLPF